jgi:zinc transport system substrate-binding protein
VAAVMDGVGTPVVLIGGNASPHTYSLRPSDARVLSNAALVVWVGPSLENFLVRPLATMAAHAKVITLTAAPGVTVLKAREGGLWEPDADEPGVQPGETEIDPHLWLDPANAVAIVRTVTEALDRLDPSDAARYDANAAATIRAVNALDADLARALEPVHAKPFVVFHDAYQYFQARYHLNAIGSITVSPDREPGAKRIAAITARIKTLGPVCIFSEPQFQPKLMATLMTETHARGGVLDPEGVSLPAGADLYFRLMRDLATNLRGCLAATSQ